MTTNTAITDSSDMLPKVVGWLGYGGLLPFAFLALAAAIDENHTFEWTYALHAYGAIILSFVGALHWGFAMSLRDLGDKEREFAFVWSVLPALIAWPALLIPQIVAAALLISGFLANYLRDRHLARCVDLPAWYLPMRFRLTSVACVCLSTGLILA